MTTNDQNSLGDERTIAAVRKLRPEANISLGDERTRGAVDAAGVDTIIDDIEVVDLESRYKIEGTLGQGGMGAVLLATDTRLGRKVAVKRILGEAARSKTAILRFLTEAKAIATLNHPNIVQIYDYGRAKDGPFLIMEYVDDGSLADRCREGSLALDAAVDIACQICDGLAKAHDSGIVHRDIKPANVLVNRDGLPKLTDFGLAKAEVADHGMTMTGAIMGTPDFMPPEQRRDATEVDHRSDLWSLAATVYQMVTGRSPKIIRFNDVPAMLQDVLSKALEERKEDRYQSAREFRDALRTSIRTAAVAAAVSELGEGQCPACRVKNDSSRKFCRGCGASLEAPCLSCDKPMPMWEEICGSCGAKQTPLVEERRQAMASRQAEAEGLLGDFEFERATSLATLLRDEPHPALWHLRSWAEAFLQRIEKTRAEQTRHAVEAIVEASKHEAAHDYLSASVALETIPESLRGVVLPGEIESAVAMLDRVTRLGAEARRLESLIKERLAARQFDELLPDVEELLELLPERKDLKKIRTQLVERRTRQGATRDEAIVMARDSLASFNYEKALAALSGVAAAAVTPEVVKLREQAEGLVRRVRELSRTIRDAIAGKQLDGLLGIVEEYLSLKPADTNALSLRQSLVDREEKFSRDIAARLEKARKLERDCRFEEAVKLLETVPESSRSARVVECLGRAGHLSALRQTALSTLSRAETHERAPVVAAAIRGGHEYQKAIADAAIADPEFSGVLSRIEASFAEQQRSRKFLFRSAISAAVLVAVVAVVVVGLWMRSAALLTQAIADGRWDEALTIEPDNVVALVGRARGKLLAKPVDLDGVFADLKRAERRKMASDIVAAARADAFAVRAGEHILAGRLDRAEEDLQLAVRGGANDAIVVAAREAMAKAWLERAQQAVARADGAAVQAAVDAAMAARAERTSLLSIWEQFATGCLARLDSKGLGLACTEARKCGLQARDEAELWIQLANTLASPPHKNASEVRTAVDAAMAAGAKHESLLSIWEQFATGCLARLDSKGLGLACTEARKCGLQDKDEAELWIRFGNEAASPPHEDTSAIRTAVNAAMAAGASPAAVNSLRAKAMVLDAMVAQKKGDSNAAIAGVCNASFLDAEFVRETLANPVSAPLREAVIADYCGKFDEAVGKKDWERALQIGAAAEKVDKSAGDWVAAAVASLPPAKMASLPPAAMASLPPAATLALPPIRNSIGIELKLLPAGRFTMGLANNQSDETPHRVTLTKPFFMGVYEVTNAQWKRVMGSVPSEWKDDNRPVEMVNWQDAMEFCQKLSALPEERQAGRVYRLPTEAEWEYACRAGTNTTYSFGDDESLLSEHDWYRGNAGHETHPVGEKKANAWGLYDMHGNVWEWCSDWYGQYGSDAVTDPQGPSGASDRVFRGGCWGVGAEECRSACRRRGDPSHRDSSYHGFRLALSPSGGQPVPPETLK